MKDKFIIANFKSNKTSRESIEWLEKFNSRKEEINNENKKIIICPSFLSIPECASFIKEKNLNLSIGVQNISEFEEGAYTGEIAAKQAKEFADYVIVGHSERRNLLLETDEIIQKKVNMAKKAGLITIVCVQDDSSYIPIGSDIISYEPDFAIGSGLPDDSERIKQVLSKISQKVDSKEKTLIYGGSVNAEDIHSFLGIEILSGFLVSSASLDPDKFISLIRKI